MHRGFVLLWRKVEDSGWIRNHKLWAFWSWCLLKASYKERTVMIGRQEVHLNPGQFVLGRKSASEATGLSEQEVRSAIGTLVGSRNLTIKSTNKFSIISITNWEVYQNPDYEINQQINQPVTNKQPTNNQQITTNNTLNNIYKEKNKKPIVATEDGLRLSSLLFSYLKERNNGHKPPDLNRWGIVVDKMIRIDKRDPSDVESVIRWCQEDSFWKNNILSTDKLRKQYDQLKLKMAENEGGVAAWLRSKKLEC